MLAAVASAIIKAPAFKGKHRILKVLLHHLDRRPVISRYGVVMLARRDDYTNFACITGWSKRDYDDVYVEVDQLEPGMAFIDIGANAGLFSLVAGQRVHSEGAVLSFEPNPAVFSDILVNGQLNGLSNISANNALVGPHSGTMTFSAGKPEHTGAGHVSEDGIPTRMIAFDDDPTFERLIGDRRVVIKIDVEGYEHSVIVGMLRLLARPQVEKVIMEIDDRALQGQGSSAAQVYAAMEEVGLRPHRGINTAAHFNEIFTR